MKTDFYDFFKIDGGYKFDNGDFSAGNGECLSGEERIDFLKNYSAFLGAKNGTEEKSEKAVSEEEVTRLTEAVSYKINHKIRKRISFDEMTAQTYLKEEDFVGWRFYETVSEKDGVLTFSDKVIPPVPCAKYEFNAKEVKAFAFSFILPEEYLDEEKIKNGATPITTDTGRIIELRKGVDEIIKLQIYRNGEIHARVGIPDPYHHKNFKLGNFIPGEENRVEIDISGDFYKVTFNGQYAGEYELTNKETPDTVFISGGMHPVCKWKFKPEKLEADGRTVTNFFQPVETQKAEKTEKTLVKMPYKIGGEKNKDKVIELTSKFNYDGGKAVVRIGSLDPSGEVWLNDSFAFKTEGFTATEKDITDLLNKGENEIKIKVMPRAPEVNYSWHRNKDPYIAWLARDVYVDILNETHVKDLVVKTTKIEGEKIKAKISFKVNGFIKGLGAKIYLAKSPYGEEKPVYSGVIEKENFEKELSLDAMAWSPDSPSLYTVRAEILKEGEPVDDEITETGFRTIDQKNGEIHLNGKRVLLNGALWMQFLPPYENIVLSHICPTTEEIVWQTVMTKGINGNVARFHILGYGNNDPRYAEVCDRLGLMNIWTTRLIDSAETTDVKKGWKAKEAYAEMMKEVINRPSIIMWEGSNEFHSTRRVLDKMFDEYVTAVKRTDDTRLICPCSHLYYGGGLYGNKGFYYQDDGEADQDFSPCESSFGWKDESVVRSAHNYEILLGYGNRWDVFRKQGWKSQPALLKSKKHAYIISEFAIAGRQDDRTEECKTYVKNDSYELADEKRAFGEDYDKLDFKLSQAYQALCAYNAVKYMRCLGADGLMWCCLTGGANDASYIKPPIDFYGYKKQAFYALKEGFQKTVCFDKKVDVVYRNNRLFEPVLDGAEKGETYDIEITVKSADGEEVLKKKERVTATEFTVRLKPFEAELKDGYYSAEYTVTKKD